MKPQDIETQSDLIEYYEELLDFLSGVVPCLGELIERFNKEEED